MRTGKPDAGLRFGLVLGTHAFARRVGDARARDVLQSSKTFNAVEALQWGFATGVEPQERWADTVAAARAEATQLGAEASRNLFSITGRDTRDAELAMLVRSASVPGLKDRIAAYLAK